MNINPISPITLTAGVPGQSVTKSIVVTNVSQELPTDVEITVTVNAAGNDPVSTPVTVTLDPEDAVPVASVVAPEGFGLEAEVSGLSFLGGQYNGTLTITTV